MMVSLISLTLVFLFITYTYTPALSHYFFLGDFLNRMGGLVFGVQEDSGAPASYIYFGKAWRSMGLYVALVWPQFLIAATSFIRWLLDIRKLASFSDRRWFLWWLYAAFGLLLVLGTIADFAGFLQENLQMRMFTPFMLFAAPVAALALRVAITNMAKKRPRMAVLLGGVFIVYGMLACMAKVTNDPFFSNVWYFYGPGELRAGQWIDSTIQDQVVWVDTWHRLRSLYINSLGEYDQSRVYEFVAGSLDTFPPYILITENTRLSANRREVILPTVNNHNQIYDNGAAQLYYRRARTPYQR
jgi:hypothetical protein